MTPVRVLITGSRSWDLGPDFAERVVTGLLQKHGPGLILIHGDCPSGVDAAIQEACEEVGVPTERHPADWQALGKGAGPRRNQAMVDLGAALCLAFSRDLHASRGTADCARRARASGIPTWHVRSEAPGDVVLLNPSPAPEGQPR